MIESITPPLVIFVHYELKLGFVVHIWTGSAPHLRLWKLVWRYGKKNLPVIRGAGVLQADSSEKPEMYSPANVHAVFSAQTVNFA